MPTAPTKPKINRSASLSWTFLGVSLVLILMGALVGVAMYFYEFSSKATAAQGINFGVMFVKLLGGAGLGAAPGLLFNISGCMFAVQALSAPPDSKPAPWPPLLLNAVVVLAALGIGGYFVIGAITNS